MKTLGVFLLSCAVYWGTSRMFEGGWASASAAGGTTVTLLDIAVAMLLSTMFSLVPWGIYFAVRVPARATVAALGVYSVLPSVFAVLPGVTSGDIGGAAKALAFTLIGGLCGYGIGRLAGWGVRRAYRG